MAVLTEVNIQFFANRFRVLISTFAGFVILCLVNGQAMLSAYAPDDYSSVEQVTSADFFLQQGRLGQAAHSVFFNRLGISIADSGPAWWILFFIAFALFTSLVIDTVIGKRATFWCVAVPTALIVSSPYWSTLLMYRRTIPDFFAAFALLAGFVHFYRRMSDYEIIKNSVLAGVCLAGALTFYQPVFPIAVMLVLWDNANRSKLFDFKWIAASSSSIVFSLVIYAVIFTLTKNMAGPGWDNRASLLNFSNIGLRIHQIREFMPLLYSEGFYIVNKPYTIATTFFTIASAIFILFFSWRKCFILLIVYIISVAVVLAPVAVLNEWDPTTRNISSFSYLMGLFAAVALAGLHSDVLNRKYAFIGISASLAAMIGLATVISDAYFLDFARKNKQNSWISQQVAGDLLDLQNKQSITSVRIVNDPTGRLYTPRWAVRGVIFEATGFRFPVTNVTQDDVIFCETSPKWPSAGYITVVGEKATVCIE